MGTLKYVSVVTTVSVFTALFAIILQAYFASEDLRRLTIILKGLKALENEHPVKQPKIAIGYGSCSDLYVRAVDFLNMTDIDHFDSSNFSVDDITTENEFLQSFAYYFQRGAASERYTANKELFQKLVSRAKKNLSAAPRWALGGNAPVMGTRFSKEGADVLLAAKMSSKLKTHLSEEILLTGDVIEQDDIHLILEYKTGDKWGKFESPRANRYILHNDQHNPMLSSLEEFNDSLSSFNPRLFVVSGLQMMDNYPFSENVREARLLKVQHQMQSQRPETLVHFEMASYVEIELLQLLMKNVIPFTNSIGMNEQELDNMQQVLQKGTISLVADSNPRVASSLNQMRTVFRKLNNDYLANKEDSTRRMITRIHVHTLAYQAFLVVKNSEWRNTKNAAAKSALVAHRHVCASREVNPDAAYVLMDDSFSTSTNVEELNHIPKRIKFNDEHPVSCWNETISVNEKTAFDVEMCLAPVLICKIAKQTAGAGDNISAAGLVLQI